MIILICDNRYAPETLKTSKYSHQSDVWSYGVTLIEMYTKPYSQPDLTGCNIVDADDILRRLENGERYVKKKYNVFLDFYKKRF